VLNGSSGLTFTSTAIQSMRPGVTASSANLTLGAHHTVYCTTGGSDKTYTLPSAASATTGYFKVIKADSAAGACTVVRAGSDTINGLSGALSAINQWDAVEVELVNNGNPGNWHGTASTGNPFAPKSTSTTYQVLTADFSAYRTLTVPSGTFTITLVASTSQPTPGQFIKIINYGSGVVTIARSGQTINGGTSNLTLNAGSATAPTSAFIVSDGTNYVASLP
jgi:hypothetical protein